MRKKFDLFIYCKTTELRSTRTLDILNDKDLHINDVIEVTLSSFNNINSSKNNHVTKINCSFHDSIEGVKKIISQVIECTKRDKTKSILLDITGFIKPYFFRILKGLISVYEFEDVQIVYTEPRFYHKNLEEHPFSKGPGKIAEIPGFGSHEGKKELLVIMLGFEGNRSLEILNEIDPHKTIAINGFPSYLLDYKDQSIILNKDFLFQSGCGKVITRASANDPIETFEVLETILEENSEHLITVAPLGTKPMALGSLMFLLKHPDSCRAVFSYPQEYVSKDHPAQQYGKTWFYRLRN